MLLLSGNWFTGLCHTGLLLYMLHLYSTRRMFVDTTDAFRQLPQQKVQRGILLGSHLALFVLVVYRCERWSGGLFSVCVLSAMPSAQLSLVSQAPAIACCASPHILLVRPVHMQVD